MSAATVFAIGVGSPKQELFINSGAGSFLKSLALYCDGRHNHSESGMVKGLRVDETVGMEWFCIDFIRTKRLAIQKVFYRRPQVVFKILLFRFKREEG